MGDRQLRTFDRSPPPEGEVMLVAIVGYEHAGKSETARSFVKRGFTVVSPSDPLKCLALELGFTRDQLWGPSSARNTPHPALKGPNGEPLLARVFLDSIGMCVRAALPGALVAASMRTDGDFVNESTRFVDEARAVKAAGGRLILRSGGAPNGLDTDAEVDLIPREWFDAVIPKMPTVEALDQLVGVLLDGWRSEAGQ